MFWAFIGTLYLIFLTWEDYRHKMTIDDRKNYFMMGMSLALIGIIKRPLWYFLVILAVVLILGFLMKRFKVLGEGDINTLMWIYYGFAIIAFNVLIVFIVLFFIFLIFYEVAKRVFMRTRQKMPFYAVILLSFAMTCIFMNLYFSSTFL